MSLIALAAAVSLLATPGYVPSVPPEWRDAEHEPDFETIPLQADDQEAAPRGDDQGRGWDQGSEGPRDLFPDEDDGEEQLQASGGAPAGAAA